MLCYVTVQYMHMNYYIDYRQPTLVGWANPLTNRHGHVPKFKGMITRVTLGVEKAKSSNLFCISCIFLILQQKIMMLGSKFSIKAEKSHTALGHGEGS